MTTSLTEFLLARIAEDERAIRDIRQAPEKCEWGELRRVQPSVALYMRQFNGPRMEAECAAKRRVVEMAQGSDPDLWPGAELAVATLALPYVEHVDYRNEWKP